MRQPMLDPRDRSRYYNQQVSVYSTMGLLGAGSTILFAFTWPLPAVAGLGLATCACWLGALRAARLSDLARRETLEMYLRDLADLKDIL